MPASRFSAWAGTRIESGVTGVTTVTETPNPSIPAALEAAAEVTLAAEPKVTRVTALGLDAVTRVTQRSTPGLPRKPIDDQCSNTGNPSNPQEQQRATSVDVAANPVWWRALFEQRSALRELNGGRPREEAEGLAFSDTILEWHHRYGARPDARRCPGCSDEFAGEAGLVLCDGARVHFDSAHGGNCLIAYGQKWRGAALAGLLMLGLDPPEGFTLA